MWALLAFSYISVTYRMVIPTTCRIYLLLSQYFAPSGTITPDSINPTLLQMLTKGITLFFCYDLTFLVRLL